MDVGVRSNSSSPAKWSGPMILDLVLEVAGRDHGTEDHTGVPHDGIRRALLGDDEVVGLRGPVV